MASNFRLQCCTPPFITLNLLPVASVLGRSPHCDIIVNHETISRRHAEFHIEGATAVVNDLNSLNGTFIKGKRVPSGIVASGDIIRFGSVSFTFTADVESEENTERCHAEEHLTPAMAQFLRSLSAAQGRVFQLLVRGEPEKTIALELRLSPHTVHNHIRAIFKASGVHSKAELIARLHSQR